MKKNQSNQPGEAPAFRETVVSGILPSAEEIEKEAESRYPVITHKYPEDSPYKGSKKTFIHGVHWALQFLQSNYR